MEMKKIIIQKNEYSTVHFQWRIQDFPEGGA